MSSGNFRIWKRFRIWKLFSDFDNVSKFANITDIFFLQFSNSAIIMVAKWQENIIYVGKLKAKHIESKVYHEIYV